jgi:hypothetical protein
MALFSYYKKEYVNINTKNVFVVVFYDVRHIYKTKITLHAKIKAQRDNTVHLASDVGPDNL